ncbi:MAG: Transcriptional regulator, ArsR family [Ktedonobacterales bacterium]|jgi:rhodanese-related sulfurtransferase|nr:MAG: Transcriptional regulator, ArsR family [Ktedonobacterales bacterium]
MGHREFKDQLYAQFARIGKALASPQRLELVDLLAQGERSVEELAREVGLSTANASQHLHVLHGARLVESRKAGLYVYYRLADPAIFALWQALRTVGERQLAEIDRLVGIYLHNRQALEPISRDALLARLTAGDTIVLDVRPALEYRQGHIAGARSIPVDELAARLGELDVQREVVAYCRGPYCVFSDEAVALLRAHGLRAFRYAEGFPEWADAGLPLATEESASATR